MNVETVDRILSDALHALGAAQAELRKSATQSELGDVLRKADGLQPRASLTDDAITKAATAALADLNRRLDRLEGARDMDNQSLRKTHTIREAA